MSATYGYDNLYNESVNDIALINYNKGIANRLRLQEQQMQNKLPFKEPQMLGGVRASNTIIPGTSIDGTPRAVGGRAYKTFTGKEGPLDGGINRYKKANRYLDFSKKVVGDAFNIYDQAKDRGGVNRYKKANRYLDFSKKIVGDAFGIYDQAQARGGMVYSPDLQKALDGCGNCSGGAKKRTGRFAKGSAEAKAWGQKMKEARMNK